ncbi:MULTISPECIES: ATP-binding cassette domain-containing protein [unclassified Rhizobium]|uniref:ABC transporter ATP-binding protein n=1 Tax=unclassified Rhizobium TaxID=2613769 RepID=UPI00161F289A|nr:MULTISPECIES: ATP-binding cassette domain-containing protein [unclassified Rhizobium]MBB3289292.1 multiple sugar transport system ATP-binding protein [Rhizobium sp. BK252]MBB3404308.1 multiple sugar transport system ATP-binding protein [Rhizobium sp. BK289]MBB3416619.1 multiple sugar transport system ATP-binding protein [Rhizobium sp. BK284]MBB3484497.1 multiple sugar transport system ATP-binding protein [Rhizobium sp. BK347]
MANVSIRELAIDFGSVSVLKSLNLEIQSGEFIVLLGPSGCGKSTLLNAIAGLTDITDGQIWIGDRNVTWEEPKDRGIGMVFQSYALYPTMTVEGNLSFGLRIAGMPKDEIAQRVDRAVQILQIDPLRKRRPGELSGGQRQRVAIGRALVRDVDVFLFDEPLSNLDARLRTELRVELKRLHSGLGSTMIYVTHDQIEALTLADRIAVMSGGVIQQFATPKEIYRRPVNRFVAGFVGSPSMNFLSGQVTSNGGVPAFALPDGRKIDLNGYEFSGTPGEGRKATLGVRPEQMQFQPAGSRAASLPAIFTIVEPMGSDNLIWGQVGSETLSVRIDADEEVALDREQPVYFQPTLASLFGEDGQRL